VRFEAELGAVSVLLARGVTVRSSSRTRISLSIALALGLAAALAPFASGQERTRQPSAAQAPAVPRPAADAVEMPRPPKPERTAAGTWDGTWFYISRDTRAALWLRTVDGRPELSLQYLQSNSLEGFKTDWNGEAEYFHQGDRGSFRIELLEADADLIQARWVWTLDGHDSTRRETADVRIYRAGDGRALTLDFVSNERTLVDHGGAEQRLPPRWFWTFRKASQGQALWEELPF
jgi:hypothetical protein